MNDTADVADDPCAYGEPRFLYERFILVAIVGTSVAVINIIENVFLCFMFFSRKSYRSSHCLYLALLAFFDIFIAGAYIPLMSLNLVVDYWRSVTLLRAWYVIFLLELFIFYSKGDVFRCLYRSSFVQRILLSFYFFFNFSMNRISEQEDRPRYVRVFVRLFTYMIPMITVSHIAMTASSFLMVAASFERYCVTVHPHVTKFLNRNRFVRSSKPFLTFRIFLIKFKKPRRFNWDP
ncbi:hypothetical protein OSTOST_04876 [Ostertagia ostertagi]